MKDGIPIYTVEARQMRPSCNPDTGVHIHTHIHAHHTDWKIREKTDSEANNNLAIKLNTSNHIY